MKNDLAKLIEAYADFWNDFNSLLRDIEYIIINKYRWTYYEHKKIERYCFFNSFYNDNNILYIYYDLNVDMPYIQISLFHISDSEDENDDEVGLNYLEENWKGVDPNSYLQNKNYEINNTENGFKVIVADREKYVFSPKIDIMSITSSDVLDEDIKNIIGSLISGTYEIFQPAYISYVDSEGNFNSNKEISLDDENYHYVLKQYGAEGAKKQAISMCQKQNLELTKKNMESCLLNLESDLEEMFEGGVDDPQ
jgi:hypothetical protein